MSNFKHKLNIFKVCQVSLGNFCRQFEDYWHRAGACAISGIIILLFPSFSGEQLSIIPHYLKSSEAEEQNYRQYSGELELKRLVLKSKLYHSLFNVVHFLTHSILFIEHQLCTTHYDRDLRCISEENKENPFPSLKLEPDRGRQISTIMKQMSYFCHKMVKAIKKKTLRIGQENWKDGGGQL